MSAKFPTNRRNVGPHFAGIGRGWVALREQVGQLGFFGMVRPVASFVTLNEDAQDLQPVGVLASGSRSTSADTSANAAR
jgi:hypothetical protein